MTTPMTRRAETTYHKHGLTDVAYNTWRKSLPDHCWHCENFDRCGPNHPCRYNPKCRTKDRRTDDV